MYVIDKNTVHIGDCLRDKKILKGMESDSIDIIICDLPRVDLQKELLSYESVFGKRLSHKNKKKFRIDKLKEYTNTCLLLIDECLRILKPKGTLYVYDVDNHLISYLKSERMYECKVRPLIWYYKNRSVHNNKTWQQSHVSILFCFKDEKRPHFNLDDMRVDGRLPRDVLEMPMLTGRYGERELLGYPDQRPLELCDKLIRASMLRDEENEEDEVKATSVLPELNDLAELVESQKPSKPETDSSLKNDKTTLLVPFAKCGTECVAAKNLGVDFIAFERDPKWVKLANKRIDFLKNTELSFEDLIEYYSTFGISNSDWNSHNIK